MVNHPAYHCPLCGEIIPRRRHPDGPLGPRCGDNSYLDRSGHDEVCSGKRKEPRKSTAVSDASPLVADAAGIAVDVADAVGSVVGGVAEVAGGAAEVAGDVCSAIAEITGNCL